MSLFKKADKKQAKLKIGLAGPSGSGKTYSALLLAKGIGGKVAVIDTENGSASLYADRFEFDVCEVDAPYTTDKYIAAMKDAESAGYDVIIIDSISHQWAGEGGILNTKEKLDSRGGNSFANWAKMTPEHEKFKTAILQLEVHTICTMRSKQEYVLTENDRGKQAPKKVGMAPVQREGLEYEFTVMFDIAIDHSAQASKDRTSLFDKLIFTPSEETGKQLMDWLLTGKKVWLFGVKERTYLKELMNSFAMGKQLWKEWETENGPVISTNEKGYLELCQKLEDEKGKALSDPNGFENFNGGIQNGAATS